MAQRNSSKNLSRLRDGWEEVEAEEVRLLRRLSVQQSLRDLLSLQRAFEPQLQRTESMFRAERLAYLEDLQKRLIALEDWKKRQLAMSFKGCGARSSGSRELRKAAAWNHEWAHRRCLRRGRRWLSSLRTSSSVSMWKKDTPACSAVRRS